MEADIAAAVEALRAALSRGGPGRRPVFAVIELVYPDGQSESLSLAGCSMPEKVSATRATTVDSLTEMEEAILGVMARAEKPLKGGAIAGRAGVRYSSHIRQVLSELIRKGKLIHAPQGGYWPADRALPVG